MSRTMRTVLVAVGVAVSGCISTGVPIVVEPVAPAPTLGDDVFVQAKGQGPTEDEAYASAQMALAAAVLGDARWAEVVPVDVHRRDGDPQLVTRADEGVEVTLGLSRARAAATISAFDSGEPTIHGPPAWHDVQMAYMRAHVAAHACARRIVLFSATCETNQTAEADAALDELGQGLVLVAAYPDGVPVDSQGAPLRDPAVFVLSRGVPLAGMPVQLEAPPGIAATNTRAVTDGKGQAHFTLGPDVAMAPMRVFVDGGALLGPRSDHAPRAEVHVDARPTGLRRWGLVVSRDGRPPQTNDVIRAVVDERMTAAGLTSPVDLPEPDVMNVLTADGDGRGKALATLADSLSGRLDRLFVLAYESRFASRMGGSRVWYEASGSLEVRDAWTGQVLVEVRERVEADGVGDKRADKAARQKLGRALVSKALASLAP